MVVLVVVIVVRLEGDAMRNATLGCSDGGPERLDPIFASVASFFTDHSCMQLCLSLGLVASEDVR